MQNQYLELYSSLNDSINRVDKQSIVEESRDQITKSVGTANDNHNKTWQQYPNYTKSKKQSS